VTGGSEANLLALAVARNSQAGFDVAENGLHQESRRLTVYGSIEMHSSVQKGLELLGLGRKALRKIPVDGDFRIDIAALKATIAEDRAGGYRPVCVVGNAGTVGTGAIDDLSALADVCEQEKLWFHVDGAFGALTALVPELRPALRGLERSDSLAFDFHKWLGVPYAAASVLTRHPEAHHGTFAHAGPYLSHMTRGVAAGPVWFSEWGIDLSRPFQALKIWMLFKHHGLAKYARIIRQNIEQAAYLGQLIAANPRLELLAPIALNVVCFRYRDPAMKEAELETLNREIVAQLHEGGDAIPSFTTVRGKYAIRAAIVNHRSRRNDFDFFVERVIEIGDRIARKTTGAA
jgi:glutamate/tyrosine decarboxylase-like PLP-dependent enzyme